MHNVIKGLNFDKELRPVEIPDTIIIRKNRNTDKNTLRSVDFNLKSYKKSDVDKLDEYFKVKNDEMLESVNEQAKALEEKAHKILLDAKTQADDLEEKAKNNSEAIIENAKNLAEEIYDEARKSGAEDGKKEVVERIQEYFIELDNSLNEMKTLQLQTIEQTQQQLRFMALEIASKVTQKKISDDDSCLSQLVNGALKEIKDADWITVTVSDKMQGLVKKLRQEQIDGIAAKKYEVIADNSPEGTVKIETQDRIIDASISTQLQNIKHYFDTYGDEEDGQKQGK